MNLQDGRGQLYAALKTLQAHWGFTEPQWRDTMRVQFVEQTLLPLQEQVASALKAIDQMEVILQRMRRECEGGDFDAGGEAC